MAIISEAASTGISLHADRKMPSRGKRRLHFCLELAWGADRVMQQLGRTHRSNQETGPVYKLMTSDRLGGDTRFVATVARRLQVQGAITQGHEGAANKSLDLRPFNVRASCMMMHQASVVSLCCCQAGRPAGVCCVLKRMACTHPILPRINSP